MKAVRFYGIGDVRCDDVSLPVVRDNEVLIKVEYAGICGSDKHIFNKGMFVENIPETMGHEFAGRVEKTGRNVTGFLPGDKVTANPMIYCGRCRACSDKMYNACEKLTFIGESRPGSFAEYISMPSEKLIKIPVNLALRSAVLCEPLAVAVHTIKRAQIGSRKKIAVTGAGPIGVLITAAARNVYDLKDITVIDISPGRLNFLREQYPNIKLQESFAADDSYDAIIDAAGSGRAFNEELLHLRPDGTLYVVSLSEQKYDIDINILVNRQLRLVGCNGYDNEDIAAALEYLDTKKLVLDFLITHEFSFAECGAAFELLMGPNKLAAKIILKP